MDRQVSKEIINYVIARPWDDSEPNNLRIYQLHGEVHRGTLEDAMMTLDRVQSSNPGFEYSVYEVFYRKLS